MRKKKEKNIGKALSIGPISFIVGSRERELKRN